MSGGKKKRPKARMYSESELRRGIRDATDAVTKRVMLLCIVAARDEFKPDADKTVQFTQTMMRYVEYERLGLVDLKTASESLKKHTGIDLRLSRWKE